MSPASPPYRAVSKTGYSATFVAVYPEALRRDGDGNRVKSTLNGVTTILPCTQDRLFIGNWFEWHTDANDKVRYYYAVYPERSRRAGGQRLAMRTGNNVPTSNLTYLFGDHLGSTSLTYKADTGAVTTQLYGPWGGVRWMSGTLPTSYTYTGQYTHMNEFGLMDYVARFYDPILGRFVQADTIVPGAGNPMARDRYAYVNNSPLNYNDPSGHMLCSPHRPCEPTTDPDPDPAPQIEPNNEPVIPTPEQGNNCDSNTSNTCFDPDLGVCIPGVGCSGYSDGWYEWYSKNFIYDDLGGILGVIGNVDDLVKLWTSGVTPFSFGVFDYAISFVGDLGLDLTFSQRIGRSLIEGTEGLGIGYVSTIAGGWAAVASVEPSAAAAVSTGQLWIVPVGVGASTIVVYGTVNYTLSKGADLINETVLFPLFSLTPIE
jgi:RHS repeat-associated protein